MRLMIAALMLCMCSAVAWGHEVQAARVTVDIQGGGAGGERRTSYKLTLMFDLAAAVVGVTAGHIPPEEIERTQQLSDDAINGRIEAIRAALREKTQFVFDGEATTPATITLPGPEEVRRAVGETGPMGLSVGTMTGEAPVGARLLALRFPQELGGVWLAMNNPPAPSIYQALAEGQMSWPLPLRSDGANQRWITGVATVAQFIYAGFLHIIPAGLDHVLFVLGLFLLSARMKPLLWQVTAFTLAHSVTLVLATLGVVELGGRYVETLIALSIVYVAVENIFLDHLTVWRPAIVFGFGLLHGLGFASVLEAWGLPQDHTIEALVSFNIGVELGQLAVIAIALALVGWARGRWWYRRWVVIPGSAAIAVVAMYWTFERMMGE